MNNTLIKGLAILETLARAEVPMGVTEISLALALPKSNTHRMLQALTDQRYVIRQPGGRYSASIKLWELGSAALSGFDLRRHAEAVMEALMERTGESVHLSVLDQREVVYLHKVESPNPVRAYSQIGGRAAAHCVATGKAMIAFRGKTALAAMSKDLESHTDRTLTDPARFLAEMEQVRKRGYAVNREEWRVGVSGVAAPIGDAAGTVIAAIGLSGPAARFKPARLRQFADEVMQAAAGLSEGLGGGESHHALSRVTSAWR
jgi:DNA-binding IclR family transcriptional regulator